MNRRNFLSSLLALIPLPFLRRKPKKDPKDAFKEAVGDFVERELAHFKRLDEIEKSWGLEEGDSHAM